MAASRVHYMLLAAASILLFIGIAHQHDHVRETLNNAWNKGTGATSHGSSINIDPSVNLEPEAHGAAVSSPPKAAPSAAPASNVPSFHEIALKYGTDKVTTHQYWFMYDKYFPSIRDKRVKMLEIGLGCDMNYGPGKSYYTWLEYFPNVDLYYMEYDAACAEKWSAETTGATIYAGDQADKVFLQKFIDETGGNFDIIIDDGGHTMNQQQVSLEMLWKIVKPGGMYFIEDLQTSFMGSYGGDDQGGKDPTKHTMTKIIYELIDDKLQGDGTRHAISAEMRSIECMKEVCLFHKKEEGTL
ncbi:hypothetical protein PG993_014328 [Apiospora rasikravindrae]|uniref:Hard-surface induced protein 5 n=1 Tax=Apiospora rasikravindrae TaxID=990691 RepID=A0ABR1RME1_9PEZI